MERVFLWSDCWLLQAIILGDKGSGCSYYDIVSTADGLNHALLSPGEMESGMARLAAAGLIEQHGDRFAGTFEARAMYQQADAGNVFETRDNLQRLMSATPWSANEALPDPAGNLHYPGYSLEKHEAANRQWQDDARKILSGLCRK